MDIKMVVDFIGGLGSEGSGKKGRDKGRFFNKKGRGDAALKGSKGIPEDVHGQLALKCEASNCNFNKDGLCGHADPMINVKTVCTTFQMMTERAGIPFDRTEKS